MSVMTMMGRAVKVELRKSFQLRLDLHMQHLQLS